MEASSRYESRSKDHHSTTNVKKYIQGPKKLGDILINENKKENTVMYIHVPFCTKICSFCNMRRSLSDVYEDYDKLLVKHIEKIGNSQYGKTTTLDSIYFGGGTPTTMNEEQLSSVLNAIYKNFKIKENAEISMETTLTELSPEKLKHLASNGLNRISVGIQTFDDLGRQLLNRTGNGEFAKKRLTEYLDSGFRNVNIDLIYNYPYQTEAELKKDLKIIGELDLAGFSMYSLILDNNSRLARKVEKSIIKIKNDVNHDRRYYDIVVEDGKKSGYDFFEFTKMVRPNRDEYKYICHRNSGEDTIPIGAGAGGSIMGAMGMNPISIKEYIEKLENVEDIVFTQFSKSYQDIAKASKIVQFGKFDISLVPSHIQDVARNYITELMDDGMVVGEGDNYQLTKEGRYWGNNINKEYMDLLVEND